MNKILHLFKKKKEKKPKSKIIEYKLQKGETIQEVCDKFQLKVEEVLAFNKLSLNPDLFFASKIKLEIKPDQGGFGQQQHTDVDVGDDVPYDPQEMQRRFQKNQGVYSYDDGEELNENNTQNGQNNQQNNQQYNNNYDDDNDDDEEEEKREDKTKQHYVETLEKTEKFNIIFVTKEGDFPGLLSICPGQIWFYPDYYEFKKVEKAYRKINKNKGKKLCLTDFQVQININDLDDLDYLQSSPYEYLDLILTGLTNDHAKHKSVIKYRITFKESINKQIYFQQGLVSSIKYIMCKLHHHICTFKKKEKCVPESICNYYQIVNKDTLKEQYEEDNSSQDEEASNKQQQQQEKQNKDQKIQDNIIQEKVQIIQQQQLQIGKDIQNKKKKQYPKLLQLSDIFDHSHFEQIVDTLPSFLQMNNWQLIFSPNKHGYSYEEFLRRGQFLRSHLIVCEDMKANIFGAYISDPWEKKRGFYGNTDCYLFTFYDENNQKQNNNENENQANQENISNKKQQIKSFKYSGDNDQVLHCDEFGISIGVGVRYGLYIDKDFMKGSSEASTTFNSKGSLTYKTDFKLYNFEIYSIDYNNEQILKDIELSSRNNL